MPRKRPSLGVDLNDLVRKGAKKLLAERAEQQRRELSGADKPIDLEQRAQVCVEERRALPNLSDPMREPRIEWKVMGSMPYGIEPFCVRASLSDAARNRETVRDLLKRRWRRGYRERLVTAGICEVSAAARISQLVDFYVVDTSEAVKR